MEISGAQPLRHLRTSCRALRGAASGVVSVSMVPVYNAADFVCALSRALDDYCGDELDLGVHRGRCVAFPDEADLMNKMLLAAAVLVFSYNSQAAQDPQTVFNRACGACHNGQLPMAPKKGDKAAWEPRLAKGMDTLVTSVTNGFNAMPPRGLCMDCTAEDYQAVIQWMTE